MDLEYFEELINKENINLINTYLEDTSGAFANYGKINAIMYDTSKLPTSIEKKQVLAEELGHYYMDATYKFSSDTELIDKQEYRAKKWAYSITIPYDKLKQAIRQGINNLYELAELFEVTMEYMAAAMAFYTEKYGIIY